MRLIADAHNLGGLVAQTNGHLNIDQKIVWRSPTSELAAYRPLEFRTGATSFRQKLAEKQDITLREFESSLREA